MSQVCFMFPGQGTQKPGMLRSLAKDMEKVEEVLKLRRKLQEKISRIYVYMRMLKN